MTDHVDDLRIAFDHIPDEGLPHAPMAMPEQRLERPPFSLAMLLAVPTRVVPVRARAGRTR